MATKRKFGSIEQLPSGKWRARYTGPDGAAHKAPITFFDSDDAAAWLKGERKLIEFDAWSPPKQRAEQKQQNTTPAYTLGSWLEQWLETQSHILKPSTMQDYRKTIGNRILNTTGRAAQLKTVPLEELSRRDIIDWWDALAAKYGIQSTSYSAFKRLHTALVAAVEREIIPTNPAANISAIQKPKPHRKKLPDIEVMNAIVDEMPERYKLITIFTLFHGLRIGEALGLRRCDITDNGTTMTIHIQGTAWRKHGEGMVYDPNPKTDAGRREVPIFTRFHNTIRDHLGTYTGTAPTAWVTTTPTGRLLMDTTYRTAQNKAKTRAGYGDVRITPHYGRVWLITTLAEQGMTPAAIGEILGQVDLKTITETYMRASQTKTKEIFGRVDSLLSE